MSLDLANLKSLLDAASPGPWVWQRPQIARWVGDKQTLIDHRHEPDEYEAIVRGDPHDPEVPEVLGYFGCGSHHICVDPADADLIVALRNAAPALIAEVVRLREALAYLLHQAELTEDTGSDYSHYLDAKAHARAALKGDA